MIYGLIDLCIIPINTVRLAQAINDVLDMQDKHSRW